MTKRRHSNPSVNHKKLNLGWAMALERENWNWWEMWGQIASWWQISAQETVVSILALPNTSLTLRMWRVIAVVAKEQLPKKTQKPPCTSAALPPPRECSTALCKSRQAILLRFLKIAWKRLWQNLPWFASSQLQNFSHLPQRINQKRICLTGYLIRL